MADRAIYLDNIPLITITVDLFVVNAMETRGRVHKDSSDLTLNWKLEVKAGILHTGILENIHEVNKCIICKTQK